MRTLLDFDAQDDVLEDLVQGVSRVQVAVGVGRAIVQEVLVVGGAVGGLPLVEVIGASLDVLVPVLRQRTRSAARQHGRGSIKLSEQVPKKPYGKLDLGSLSVDAQLFDIVVAVAS